MPVSEPDRRALHTRVEHLASDQLARLDDYLSLLELASANGAAVETLPAQAIPNTPGHCDWPHAPVHRVSEHGTYFVTGSTLHKLPLFRGGDLLSLLQEQLLALAKQHGWSLESWAVFPNHYHFVAHSGETASKLDALIDQLHADTARSLNKEHATPGRPVWFNFWDTALTYQESYFARLAYVHTNPVRHGLVSVANQYRWCSAAWFERTATPAQVKTIYRMKTDRVRVRDDFDVNPADIQ